MKRTALVVLTATISTGCNGDFLKHMEGKAYDRAAKAVSEYCERVTFSDVLMQERMEARREIRQRGTQGPAPITLEGLDDQTAGGKGPIVRIYCHGEMVPTMVWKDLIK